mgnify:CR=1 FL=1
MAAYRRLEIDGMELYIVEVEDDLVGGDEPYEGLNEGLNEGLREQQAPACAVWR